MMDKYNKFHKLLSIMVALVLLLSMLPRLPIRAGAEVLPQDSEADLAAADWPVLNTDLTHIICYGQSFSVGADAPGYPDDIVDGTYVLGSVTGSKTGDALKPLQMTTGNQHPVVSAVNSLSQMLTANGIDADIIAGSYGSGGRTIAQLMSPERQAQIKEEEGYSYDILSAGTYQVFQNSVEAIQDYAENTERSVSCPAIIYLQGETDQNTDAQLGYPENPIRAGYGAGGDKEKYKLYMSRLKEDMQKQVMEAYGQTEKPLFLIYQVSGTYTRTDYSSINMAQLEFAQENEDVILIQTPYFTPHYTNSHHLTVNGYRWLGEYIARSLYTALVEREKAWPMLPENITVEAGNAVRIRVAGAQNGLAIDTYTVEDASDSRNLYGFCLEVNGARVKPASVTISGDEILVTLPRNVNLHTAEKAYLIYAGRRANGTGNIRDNCADVGFYNYLDDSNDIGTGKNQGVSHSALDADGNSMVGRKYPLYNWLVSFCYELPVSGQKEPAYYHWEMQENGLVYVTEGNGAENTLTLVEGSVEDGVLNEVQYTMEKPIELRHDCPWVIEWKAAGNGNSYPGGKFLSASYSGSHAQYLYLPADSRGMVAWGVGSDSANYGFLLKNHGIDARQEHVYRIENRIADDGVNTVYLLVDGVEIGPMNTGYRTGSNSSGAAGSVIEEPKNWANGNNIYMDCIGAGGVFLLKNMKLSYLKVWESGEPNQQMSLMYHDHYDISGKTVEIVDAGTPTSYQDGCGGEENAVLDTAVVTLEGKALVATGIGTAKVRIDGTLYEITVKKARINLIVIMGQSNAGNHFANATSDVTCPVGTAYWWGNGQGTAAKEPVPYTQPSKGFHTPLLAELYAQSVAAGAPEKNVMIWHEGITSKNGKSITAWASSAENTSGTDATVTMIENCLSYYTRHSDKYEIVDKCVYWLQGESDTNMDPVRYETLFSAMWQRLKAAGMEYLAFFRVRRGTGENDATHNDLSYSASLSAQIKMINKTPEFYMATDLTENWVGTADVSHTIDISGYLTVMDAYGASPSYADEYGNTATYADGRLTTTMKTLYGSNNACHYGKFGYGLIGADAAYCMYRARHTEEVAIVVTDTSGHGNRRQLVRSGQEITVDTTDMTDNLSFRTACGSTTGTLKLTVRSGEKDITPKVVVESGPLYGSVSVSALQDYEDVSIEIIYATAKGVVHWALCKVISPVPQPQIDYIWDFNEDLNARDKDGNTANSFLTDPLQGSYSLENGYLQGQDLQLQLEQCIELHAEKNWSVEWKYGEFSDGTAGFLLCQSPSNTVGNKAFYHTHNGRMMISDYVDSAGYRNYTSSNVVVSEGDCLRITNRYNPATGKSTLSLWQNGKQVIADFQLKGSMNNYTDSLDMTGYPLSGDFNFRYLGNRGMANWGVNCQLDYLKISFGDEQNEHLPGDINGDGTVNNKDATRLFQYMTGWRVEVAEAALDVNGDGKVNNKDATRLFQYLSGWNVKIY